ncbi:MAG: Uma2 family endonuclease [Elainellaceae cyanobacterium]
MVNALPNLENLTPEHIQDRWIKASWDDYVKLTSDRAYESGRCYYDNGWMRIEMSPLGPLHGRENSIVSTLVSLFTALKNFRSAELTNTSFRRQGVREGQPDIAFYVEPNAERGSGALFRLPPRGNLPVDVDEFGAPQLVVEIASTSLDDDLGRKRLLYERLGVREYWVVDVNAREVLAFEVQDGGSRQIRVSQVLVGLDMALVEEALCRSETQDDGEINRWLIQVFSG